MGRSRGGLTTKVHALVNERGLPLALRLSPGNEHDIKSAKHLLSDLKGSRQLLADRAYDANWTRKLIADQGAEAVIPSKRNRLKPIPYDEDAYKKRNVIERFFGRIKASYRRIATRYDKLSTNYMAMLKLACLRLWCAYNESAA